MWKNFLLKKVQLHVQTSLKFSRKKFVKLHICGMFLQEKRRQRLKKGEHFFGKFLNPHPKKSLVTALSGLLEI
jgi:hypothetical protein